MPSPATSAPALTTENLRQELQRFATDDLQNGLNVLYSRIERVMQNELQGVRDPKRQSASMCRSDTGNSMAHTGTGSAYSSFDAGNRVQHHQSIDNDMTPREETVNSASPLIEHATPLAAPQPNKRDSWQPFLRGNSSGEPAQQENLYGDSQKGEDSSVVRFQTLADTDKAPADDGELDFQLFDSMTSVPSRTSWVRRYRKSVVTSSISAASQMSRASRASDPVASKKLKFEPAVPFGGGFRMSYAPEDMTIVSNKIGESREHSPHTSRVPSTDGVSSNLDGSSSPQKTKLSNLKSRKTYMHAEIDRVGYTPLGETALSDQTCLERAHQYASEMVMDPRFDYIIGALILLNATLLGIETDWQARNWPKAKPRFFEVINAVLCVAFAFEISMRLIVHGCLYFSMPGWPWNAFDFAMVSLQLLEEALRFVCVKYFGVDRSWHYQFLLLRLMRIFRIVRVLRLVHVLHLVGELRMLLVSVAGSVRSLFWTVLLLLLLTYVVGLYLTQLVVDYKMQNPERLEEQEDLIKYYGTLGRTMLSLYQTISDGIHWHEVMDPLVSHCSQWIAVIFALYIAFAMFALMNVITGVFVESAMRTAEEDKRRLLINQMRQLFEGADLDGSGTISWKEFQSQLENPQMQTYLKAIDLHQEEARELFHLLDCDGNGEIDAVDFVNGCLRLHGSAKAIDFAAFLHEYRWLSLKLMDHVAYAERCWGVLCPSVQQDRPDSPMVEYDVDCSDESRAVGVFDMKRAFTLRSGVSAS